VADRRIKVPKDKTEIIRKLKFDTDENPNGIFKQYSDIMVFASMIGYKKTDSYHLTEV
jgi:hypothetical protein